MYQIEMSEVRSIVTGATSRSLVLVDEICRGTETAKGTCIAGSIIETLDKIGCLGIVSTHLHDIFSLPLTTKNTVHKAMGSEYVDGQPKPTWKLLDGICRESLAFETAQGEGVPENIIRRAEQLYLSSYAKGSFPGKKDRNGEHVYSAVEKPSEANDQLTSIGKRATIFSRIASTDHMEVLQKEVERAVSIICYKKLVDLCKMPNASELAVVKCVLIAAREQPPPLTIGASSVYVMLRPDKRIYVGEVLTVQLLQLVMTVTTLNCYLHI